MSGARSYHAGLAAESSVMQRYLAGGLTVAAHRWRGQSGEIDVIARDGDTVVFIEVKQSRTHAEAAEHLTARQFNRIYCAAEEFLAGEPLGSLTNMRFDVALVDDKGMIEIVENAYAT
jgi:putative endonuclease